MIELKSYAMKTDQGPHLNLNEDVVEADLANNLFMVVDGFGGSNIGDRAAGIIRDNIKRSFTKIAIDPESTLPFFFSHKYLIEGNALINAFFNAHQAVNRDNEDKNLDQRGGGSVLAAAVAENIVTLVSTGNCIAYLYRKGTLTQELMPDSLANVSRDNFEGHRQSMPMSGIGLFEDLHYTVRELKLSNDDLLILMTDGAYGRIDADEIKHILEKYSDKESEAINQLFKLANDRGNLDNQSALILQF
jgi:serine/threonine protein phosphatase PrpC